MASWHVYLVLCRDNTLYCGIAISIPRRVAQHNAGAGARYIVPSRRPVVCVWKRRARNQGDALRLEYWLKQRDAGMKKALVERRFALRRAPSHRSMDGTVNGAAGGIDGWRMVPIPVAPPLRIRQGGT
jgi:putative endonuclease